MIIKGNVQTMEGPVPIEEIAVGVTVITGGHVPAKVIDVKTRAAKAALRFKLNPSLTVEEGAGILTAYGIKPAKEGSVMMRKASGGIVPDELIVVKADNENTGYGIVLADTRTVLVNGYGVEAEHA